MIAVRRWITHPSLALGSTLVAGLVELLALTRSRVRVAVRPAGRRAAPSRRRPLSEGGASTLAPGAPAQPKR